MMNRNIYTTIFTILSVFLSVFAAAQSKTVVKATIDRSSILIGEPIQLTLEADIPSNEPIRFFRFDTLPHFEFLRREKIDTSDTNTGTVLKQLIHITSFDSGHWVIAPFVLGDQLVTDSLPIDVGFSSPFDPQQPYHDVKDIIEVTPQEKPKKETWWYYVAAAGALLIVLILWLLLRKKKKPVVQVVATRTDPYKTAMDALAKLQSDKHESKYYYSQLTDIFRVYLYERKGIHSMQETMNDLMIQLLDLNLPKQQFDKLSQSLRLSDFVKFAKYIPTPEDDKDSFVSIQQAIMSVEHSAVSSLSVGSPQSEPGLK